MKKWNERFAYALKKRQMTVAQLAAAIGLTHAAVSGWVNGNTKEITHVNLLNACRVLKVNPYWLGLGEGEMEAEDVLDDMHVSERILLKINNIEKTVFDSPLDNLTLSIRNAVICDVLSKLDNADSVFIDSYLAANLTGRQLAKVMLDSNKAQQGENESKLQTSILRSNFS